MCLCAGQWTGMRKGFLLWHCRCRLFAGAPPLRFSFPAAFAVCYSPAARIFHVVYGLTPSETSLSRPSTKRPRALLHMTPSRPPPSLMVVIPAEGEPRYWSDLQTADTTCPSTPAPVHLLPLSFTRPALPLPLHRRGACCPTPRRASIGAGHAGVGSRQWFS